MASLIAVVAALLSRKPPMQDTHDIEERLPIVDANGRRMTLIRTRTFRVVLRSVGPVEVEKSRRHTLPGYGHVRQVSDTEFEVFRGGFRLKLADTPAEVLPLTDDRRARISA